MSRYVLNCLDAGLCRGFAFFCVGLQSDFADGNVRGQGCPPSYIRWVFGGCCLARAGMPSLLCWCGEKEDGGPDAGRHLVYIIVMSITCCRKVFP